jgi:SAM-dependent methyltransferase
MSTSRACPVCAARDAAPVYRQHFGAHDLSAIREYTVVVCRPCGAAYADGIPPQRELDRYYREWSKYEHAHRGGKETESDERRFRAVAALVSVHIRATEARIVELGCATGRQLALLREAGFANVEGLDPSPACARAAADLYGIRVTAGTIFDWAFEAGGYDFVLLAHVLEHIEDVGGAMLRIRSILKTGGRVYVEVPDASRLAGRLDAPYQEFSTEHVNFFSPSSLGRLFVSCGFREVVSGRVVRESTPMVTCPSAYGIFEKCEGSLADSLPRDEETAPALARYIEECGGEDARIRAAVREGSGGRAIIVWGTGAHTQRLLATGAFEGIPITAFVDSNPRYQGHSLNGVPVLSPNEIRGREEPILVSSRGAQLEISDQIRNGLGMGNDLILLY